MRRPATVPDVGQQQRPALHLLRTLQCRAIVPEVVAYRAAINVCVRASSTSRPCISYVRCGAWPACLMRLPRCCHQRVRKFQQHKRALHLFRAMRRHAIVPDVIAYGAAISVRGSSSSTSRHYVSYEGCGAMPLRRMWATAATGGRSVASVLSGERCRTRASRRMGSRAVLPLAHVRRARRASRLCSPYERCDNMTSRRRCQQHQPVLPLLRALQRHGIVPCCPQRVWKGQRYQRALLLSRAMRCHAIVPDVANYGAAISVCERCPQHRPTLHFLRSDTAPCLRAGGGHLRCGPQCVQKCRRRQRALHLLRVMRRLAIGPVVIAYGATVGVWEKGLQHRQASLLLRAMPCHAIVPDEGARSTSRPYISHARCSAIPSCRTWSPPELPSARANRASSSSRAFLSYVRCGAMPPCWLWSPTARP